MITAARLQQYESAWLVDNKGGTDWSEPDNQLGTVDGGKIRNELRHLGRTDAGGRH